MKALAHGKCEVVGSVNRHLILVTGGHVFIWLRSPFRRLACHAPVTGAAHGHYGDIDSVPGTVPESCPARARGRHGNYCPDVGVAERLGL
jgi:hypothetical protein